MRISRSEIGLAIGYMVKSLLLFAVTVAVFILCYDTAYKAIAVLPLAYMILNALFSYQLMRNRAYPLGLICKIELYVVFIRYVLTPLSIALTGEFYTSRANTSDSSVNLAVALMVVELFGAYLVMYVAHIYYAKRIKSVTLAQVEIPNNTLVLTAFAVLGTAIILMGEPNALMPASFFVLGEDYSIVEPSTSLETFYHVLGKMVKPVAFLVFFSTLKRHYDKTGNRIFIWLSCALAVLFVGMYTGTRRWQIVFAGITSGYLIVTAYDDIPQGVMLGLAAIVSISFFSTSLYKFSWAVQGSSEPIRDIAVEMFGMFQDYFSGPRVVANSIEMKSVYGRHIGLATFANDFLGSVPIVARRIDQTDRINAYFNMYHNLHTTPLIMPMIGIGYCYCPIFPPIFSMLCQWLVVAIDYRFQTSEFIQYRYLYLYWGLYLAMFWGFNTQIVFGTFIIPFLPLLLLFKLNDRICMKKRRPNGCANGTVKRDSAESRLSKTP